MESAVPGFEVAFHGALSEPITLGGAPRMAAVLIGTMTAVLTLGLQAPWIGLPLGAALHGAAAWMTRRDPHVFDILRRHVRQPAYLDG